jgi:8-oxo-dGTP pyrophosphatase MutT (NUDIX family)
VPVEPRPAASVILVRRDLDGRAESYVIRRARQMRFLGGYYAFPGGKVDLADRQPATLKRLRGIDTASAAGRLGDTGEVPPLAYWVTAVRELFEETGLLLAVDADGSPVDARAPAMAPHLESLRARLVSGELSFGALLASEGWLADAAALAYLSHFITPPTSPIRFSARFFLCPLPAGQAPRLILEETSAGVWTAPADAYRRFASGEWPMAEPAEYAMRYLAQFESYDALWAHHLPDAGHAFEGIIHLSRLDRVAAPGA